MVKDHSVREKKHTAVSTWAILQLAATDLLYGPSSREDSTYHSLWYTSYTALAGMRNSSMGPPKKINEKHHSYSSWIIQLNVNEKMKGTTQRT